jgi:hypothetical protein
VPAVPAVLPAVPPVPAVLPPVPPALVPPALVPPALVPPALVPPALVPPALVPALPAAGAGVESSLSLPQPTVNAAAPSANEERRSKLVSFFICVVPPNQT